MSLATQIVSRDTDDAQETRQSCRATWADGLLEQTFDPATRKHAFALRTNGKITTDLPRFALPNVSLLMEPVRSEMIENGRLVLPSRPQEFGSTEALISEIAAHLDRYVVFPTEYRPFIPHYILFTWVYDRFKTVPYLRFIGDMGVGKSRALQVVGELCYHPFSAAGSATMSPIFRGLKLFGGGTLVMDELDFSTRNDSHNEMMTLLRQGFQAGAGVLRSTGDEFAPTDFPVFGPKILGGRKNFPDAALESRCIRIYMQSGMPHDHVPIELPECYPGEVGEIQNMLLQWRFDNFFKPFTVPERLPVESRLNQLYIPLASVTEDPFARNALRESVLALQDEMAEARRESREGQVLAALLALTTALDPSDAPHQVQLKAVVDLVGNSGRSLTSKQVGTICAGFGLEKGTKTNQGARILFDPSACSEVIRKYGLAPPEQDSRPEITLVA